MVEAGSWQNRQAAAEKLRAALVLPDRSLVHHRRILVLDDVFTGGRTLNEVARALKQAGAAQVAGLTLGRQPWKD